MSARWLQDPPLSSQPSFCDTTATITGLGLRSWEKGGQQGSWMWKGSLQKTEAAHHMVHREQGKRKHSSSNSSAIRTRANSRTEGRGGLENCPQTCPKGWTTFKRKRTEPHPFVKSINIPLKCPEQLEICPLHVFLGYWLSCCNVTKGVWKVVVNLLHGGLDDHGAPFQLCGSMSLEIAGSPCYWWEQKMWHTCCFPLDTLHHLKASFL